MSQFKVGQKVVCIDANFPHIKAYGGSGNVSYKPKKGGILVIDENLGDFLRFDKYDTVDSFNWWFHNRFRPLDHAFADEVIKMICEQPETVEI